MQETATTDEAPPQEQRIDYFKTMSHADSGPALLFQ